MLDWRLAESLKKLREQINAAYPHRDKTSDGAIGDAAHASRKSDHNPWIFDPVSKKFVVSAIDIDEDLGGKEELQDIIAAICASRDERVKYIIYEGKITVAGSKLQRWKKYTGKNPHNHHAHISVESSKKLYDNRSDWDLGIPMIQRVKDVPSAAADGSDRSKAESDASPSVESASNLPQKLSEDTHRENAATLQNIPVSLPVADQSSNDQTTFSLGGYAQTAQEKFDKVNELASGIATRKDAAKSLWTTVIGAVSQPFWAISAFFMGLPREVWITVAIVAGVLTVLYLYRQISLGKIRETAKHALPSVADIL